MRVNEIANRFHVSSDTVRYYVRICILKPKRDPINGYKRFDRADANRLQFVLNAKRLGFSLSDIQHILTVAEHGDSPCSTVRDLIQQRLALIKAELDASFALYQRMQDAASKWQSMPDQPPIGDTICALIQGVDVATQIDDISVHCAEVELETD